MEFQRESVTAVGIVGTGMIATALAVLTTGHGYPTVVYARSEGSEARFREGYRAHFALFQQHGIVTEAQIGCCETYLSVARDYDAMRECVIVFESVVEDLDAKHAVYRALEASCPDVRVIASVSSSIVPDALAEGIDRYGDRIIVTHPFNPAHIVPFFELCQGAKTRGGVMQYMVDFLESMGRKPVCLKKPTPGFIGNRLQFALWRECLALVDEGVCEPRDIDRALNYSFCPRYTSIGIFEHFDSGGLQLNRAVCKNLFPIISDAKEVPPVIDALIAEGKDGARSGEGFYDWRGVDMEAYAERVNEPYWKFCQWDFPEKPQK